MQNNQRTSLVLQCAAASLLVLSLSACESLRNFVAGKEGDFIVLDLAATPLMARRIASTADLIERLFVLMMLGDDRAIFATHIMGKREYARSPR